MSARRVPVLIETHGKQAYLFGTGKRRESVGASQLVHAVAADWAVAALTAHAPDAVVLMATSGTVLAFVSDAEQARAVVRAVTGRALRQAPGLGVNGVVGAPIEWDGGAAPAAVRDVFGLMADARVGSPSPAARFPVWPLTELCPSSALPAAGMTRIGDEGPQLRSATSLAKLAAYEGGLKRLAAAAGLPLAKIREAARRLDGSQPDSPDRVAVVHADGNGLGSVFANLDGLLPLDADRPDTSYARRYRAFSDALNTAAVSAFKAAVAQVAASRGAAPDVLPLVLGGDDLTFVADAAVAAQLTRAYMTGLVRAVAADPATAQALRRRPGGDSRMGVAAGMVVVTPHFPFTSAYRVADELVGEVAKQAKAALVDVDGHPVPCVSMAMHLQLDSTAGSVERIDEDLTVRGRRLSAMPYAELVGVGEPVRELSPDSAAWLRGRGLDELWSLAQALVERDAERRRVRSSAQLHELRLRLRPDPAAADEYIGRLVDADSARWRALLEGERSLFTERDGGPTTRFLDALSLGPYLTEYEAADA